MSKLLKRILFFGLLLLPAAVFAADNSDSVFRLFTPQTGDLSVKYLGELFGTVGGVLQGSGGQMMGQLFHILNSGILVIAGAFLVYTVFSTVINTAQDGEIMGRKFSSAWIAVRTAAGIILLIPSKATGYSMIQVIVMWVVIQGAGLANQAWERAINYLTEEGGMVYVAEPTSAATMKAMVPTAQNILKSEVCMYKARNLEKTKNDNMKAIQQENGDTVTPTPLTTKGSYGYDLGTNTIKFGSQIKNGKTTYNNECGEYSWYTVGSSAEQKYVAAGVQQMVFDVAPVAKKIADLDNDKLSDSIKNQAVTALSTASIDYANIIKPALGETKTRNKAKLDDLLAKSKKQGWLLAGAYYRTLGKYNVEAGENYSAYLPAVIKGAPTQDESAQQRKEGDEQNALAKLGGRDQLYNLVNAISFKSKVESKLASIEAQSKTADGGKIFSGQAVDDGKVFSGGTIAAMIGTTSVGGAVLTAIAVKTGQTHIAGTMAATTVVLVALQSTWVGAMNAPQDPIIMLQGLGNGMIAIATAMWLVITAVIFAGILVGSVGVLAAPAVAMAAAAGWFLPIIGTIMGSLFVMGLTFAIYIPLIPYLIFTFAVIGWLIAVIEAMVAAPLVALGVTHPEGHDWLGKAEQAMMLLLSVFMRPVLLVIGLIGGMILARVSVKIVNAGFAIIAQSTGMLGYGFNIFGMMALLVVYTFLMVYIVNTAFNLIPLLPEKVMRWLGLSPDAYGYQQELQGIKGGLEGASQGAASGISKGYEALGSSGKLEKAGDRIKAKRAPPKK